MLKQILKFHGLNWLPCKLKLVTEFTAKWTTVAVKKTSTIVSHKTHLHICTSKIYQKIHCNDSF